MFFKGARTLFRLGKRKKEIQDILDFVNQNGGINKDDPTPIDDWRPKLKVNFDIHRIKNGTMLLASGEINPVHDG